MGKSGENGLMGGNENTTLSRLPPTAS